MIDRILPPSVAAAEMFADDPAAAPFPEERAAVAKVVESRRREFATARACARSALAKLGMPPVAVVQGERGAPSWPAGVVGSITHCTGYRAAAVALDADVTSLGVDAEPNEALPEESMLDLIALDGERARIRELASTMPGICWDRLLFCAKESVYKAWFPLARCWLGFESADVIFDALYGTFGVHLLVPGPLIAGEPLTWMQGRWTACRGLLLTAVVVLPRRQAQLKLMVARIWLKR